MICPYLKNNYCSIASEFVGDKVVTTEKACIACSKHHKPRQPNDIIAGIIVKHNKNLLPKVKHFLSLKDITQGPGTELAKLVSWFKFTNKKCKCAERIIKMNRWGPDECERRRPTIIRWLRHSAYLNGIPFNRTIVEVLLNKAIRNAR